MRVRDLLREAPDHYELLDAQLIARLAGFLFCCASAIAGLLLVLHLPTHGPLGGRTWAAAALVIALAGVSGVGMLAHRRPLPAWTLMAIALSGPVMIAVTQWLTGGRQAYGQLLILSIVWGGVVLPPRRLALVAVADAFVVFLPVLYGHGRHDMVSDRLATVAIVLVLALVAQAHSARMRAMRRQLLGERAQADELARVDALTGLGNRRALDEALVAACSLASRSGRPLSALVGDLDGFKQINDRFGHHDGDTVLRAVAAVLRDVVRAPDSCFRWGGDEFVILLADVGAPAATDIAARLAAAVSSRCATSDGTPVTLSLGAAEHHLGTAPTDLLTAADAALLAAKAGTRSGAAGA